ncbi:MAG: AbrB/MazE/SpoVT family DNA-binding domain-containing protein [Eubacteriales bacterium]|nr:AbrB/MazE/SpoVT family DNA-binding domain-containing protein [Eubacteriales bacterium]
MQHITDRTIDNLGRIVIPKTLRKKLCIDQSCRLRLYEENEKIIIERASRTCKLCGSFTEINSMFCICSVCMKKIKEY